jgi:hypothetical protein
MPSNFSSLRKSRSSLLAKLADTAKQQSSKQTKQDDERFWKLTTDPKTGIGYARIRFLPPSKNEEVSWARLFRHAFQGTSGSWFIENCPTTLNNRPCPACKKNNELWNSGLESDKDVARKRKRNLQYISNILVIEDPAHPENNGKVFLFKYGKKIHVKIMELVEPQFPDRVPTNPFDIWEGSDFKLKAQKVAGYPNYDKSEFVDASELFATEKNKEALQEEVWTRQYALAEFTAEAQFKTYEALEQRLNAVLSGSNAPVSAAAAIEQEQTLEIQDDELPVSTPKPERAPRAPKKAEPKVVGEVKAPEKPQPPSDDDEEALGDFFNKFLDDEN